MKLHLANEYSTRNLGDALIYRAIAQLATPLPVHSKLGSLPEGNTLGLLPRESHGPEDVHLSVGGDIFNNARPNGVSRGFLRQVRDLAERPPQRTFLFGQSIPGSCRGLPLLALAWVLRRLSSVTVRDSTSHAVLRALKVEAELSHDTAFALRLPANINAAGYALFAHSGLDADRCVLITARDFDAMYPTDREAFVQRMEFMVVGLLRRGHQVAVLIQSAAEGADCDVRMAQALKASVPSLAILDPFAIAGPFSATDYASGAIGLARAVVAVRYHTAVVRLLAGREPFSLHYSIKGEELARRLRLQGMALPQFDPEMAIKQVERSGQRIHDPSPQRNDVKAQFQAALERAGCAAPDLQPSTAMAARAFTLRSRRI